MKSLNNNNSNLQRPRAALKRSWPKKYSRKISSNTYQPFVVSRAILDSNVNLDDGLLGSNACFFLALFQAVAVDIDKEEEALRSGIERSALALKSRLEQPLMKNDSMDSTETGPSSDSASACTTQPLGT